MQEAPTLDAALTQRMLAAVEVRTHRGGQPSTRLLAAEPMDISCVGLLPPQWPAKRHCCAFCAARWRSCLLICMLHAIKLQAAAKEDRFVLFVAAPEYDEIYVSLNRRSQPYNRLVRGLRVRMWGLLSIAKGGCAM